MKVGDMPGAIRIIQIKMAGQYKDITKLMAKAITLVIMALTTCGDLKKTWRKAESFSLY